MASMLPKVQRDAFVYEEPQGDREVFAQCIGCLFFDKAKNRCGIHGPDVSVYPDSSCVLYVHGEPHEQELVVRVTPKESGLVHRQVRCENCIFYNPTPPDGKKPHCELYEHLNDAFPEVFDLDKEVNEYGCCNAQTNAGDSSAKSKPIMAILRAAANAALMNPETKPDDDGD